MVWRNKLFTIGYECNVLLCIVMKIVGRTYSIPPFHGPWLVGLALISHIYDITSRADSLYDMKSIWIVSCIILSFIHQTKSFTPTIPPRFDDVIEHLVGTWSNPKTGNEYGTVEEVMRSCGGAIQGMREVPISPLDRLEIQIESFRPYHNRAYDGFIFFDCGSYTQGPVDCTTKVNNDDNGFIATLVFQSIPKRRMLIRTNPNILMTVYMNMMRKKMDPSEKRIKQVVDDSDGSDLSRRNISLAWNKHIVCQMPTEGQVWMLNRAKWLKFEHLSSKQLVVDVSLELESTPFNGDDDIHAMMGWTECIVHKDVDDINGNHRLSSLLDFNHLKDVILPYSYIIQMGAYCNETKEVKALLRVYDDQNQLKSVILQHGVVCDSL